MAEEFDLKKQLKDAEKLKGTRNRERIKKLRSSDPGIRGVAAKSIGQDKTAGTYTDRQARDSGKLAAAQEAQSRGLPLSPAQQRAVAGAEKAESQKQAALEKVRGFDRARQALKKRAGKGLADLKQSIDYPNPLTLGSFAAFMIVAIVQDVVPLIFDVVGVGWLVGYALLPFTWFCYLYLIVRRAPHSLKKKFILRTALVSAAALIPVVGELMPEWIGTTVGAYIFIQRYETRQKVKGGEGEEGEGGEKKEGGKAKAPGSSPSAAAA